MRSRRRSASERAAAATAFGSADAKAAGIDGCLLTDVSVEEAEDYVKVMREAGLEATVLD